MIISKAKKGNTKRSDFNVLSIKNTELHSNIEKDLIYIFNQDKDQQSSVFSFVKKDVIKKIAYFISGCANRPIGIGIAGETASGKSTVAMDIIESLERFQKVHNLKPLITRINTDDYYYDRSKMVKAAGSFAEFAKTYDLDTPEAFELELLNKHIEQLTLGNDVMLPKYDMSGTAVRYDNHTLASPSKIIISEGMYTLTDKVKEAFDINIYVDISTQAQKERFFKRSKQRGLGDGAEKVYKNAVQKALTHVKPTAKNADLIINGETDREQYKIFVNKILSIVEKHHIKSKFLV